MILDEKWLIKNILQFIFPLLTGLIAWLVSKRHYQNRELRLHDIHILGDSLNLYKNMLDDLTKRDEAELKKRDKVIEELKEEIIDLNYRLKKLE